MAFGGGGYDDIGLTRPTLKLGPTLYFFFEKKKNQKNNQPTLENHNIKHLCLKKQTSKQATVYLIIGYDLLCDLCLV